MAIRGIAPLCIFCIICIISGGSVIPDGIPGDAGLAADAVAGGAASVCWCASCANADAAGTIASMLVAQRTAVMEANFIGDSLRFQE
jgi:hypothetical protein